MTELLHTEQHRRVIWNTQYQLDPRSFVGKHGAYREGKRGKKNCTVVIPPKNGSKEELNKNTALVINYLKARATELISARRGSQHCSNCQLNCLLSTF